MSVRNKNELKFARTAFGKKVHITNNNGGWYENESHCGIRLYAEVTAVSVDAPELCKSCLKAARSKGVV